jgi:polysaccharide export outer membrane protein
MAFTEGANASSQPGEQKTSAKDALEVPAGYVIGPEDVLAVTVWKEPDFSGQVAVRPDGKISLPLINDIQASGLKPVELSSELVEKLKTYVTDPRVTVTVTSINSQRFYALGEVVRQGAFTLQPNMTVLQGLSTAGGLSEFAASKKIYVLRMESGKQVKLPFNYKEVLRGRNSEQNVVLKKGDTIVVP